MTEVPGAERPEPEDQPDQQPAENPVDLLVRVGQDNAAFNARLRELPRRVLEAPMKLSREFAAKAVELRADTDTDPAVIEAYEQLAGRMDSVATALWNGEISPDDSWAQIEAAKAEIRRLEEEGEL